jgi:hypothetical protein
MKAVRSNAQLSFEPFDIKITVETREEAQALYAIFNNCQNSDLLGSGVEITNAIGKEYYVNDSDKVIARGITYRKYYK